MNKESTYHTDLLENLDEWIEDALKNSKPIGFTLSRARTTITDQYDRICELWDTLDVVRRERNKAQEQADIFLEKYREYQERCINAERESLEQARLLDMSAEREAKLIAQLAAERTLADRLAMTLGTFCGGPSSSSYEAWKEARDD